MNLELIIGVNPEIVDVISTLKCEALGSNRL